MKFQATVKVVNEVKTGISRNTGDEYKYQTIVIEVPDGEKTARMVVSLGTREVESVQKQGIEKGSQVVVDLSFTTVVNFSKYVDNRIYVNEIASIQTPQTPSSLPLNGEGGYGNLPQVQVPSMS